MADTTIIEREVTAIPADVARTPFSWSAAIAGALAATAVALIIIALGSGIGLSFASPYSGPSATSLTIAAAVWLVMAQTIGFATGGYLAGRLRSPMSDLTPGETAFRDAAEGLVVWAIGVVAMASLVAAMGLFAASATTQVAAGAAAGTAASTHSDGVAASTTGATEYFVDLLFRPKAGTAAAGQAPATGQSDSATVGAAAAGARPALDPDTRAVVTRILVRSVAQGRLDDDDRAYLAQVVAARTGLAPDEAERRVTDVEGKARESVKEAAEKAAKAGAYFSFWTFMSLLFGGAAATLGGMLGGQLRDSSGDRQLAEIS
jgi:hypothetical protein